MFWLALLNIFNAVANQLEVVNKLRLPIPGFPVGILEGGAILCFVWAVFFGGQGEFQSRRMHPALIVTLTLLVIGIIIGTVDDIIGQVGLETYFRWARELGSWPLFIFIGYRLIHSPRSATIWIYVVILCGFLTATMLLVHFGSTAENIQSNQNSNFNAVRTVWYVDSYAGMASMVLAYSLIAGETVLPKVIAAPLACYCLAGQFAPLHRVEWLGMTMCACGLLTLVPAGKRVAMAIKGILVIGLLFVAIIIAGMIASSITQHDFFQFANERITSLLPTERETSKEGKAWDTRLDSLETEFHIWTSNPIFGRGLGIQDDLVINGKITNYGAFHHNGWMAILAQMGIIGFAGFMMIIGGLVWVGRKLVLHAPTKSMRLMGVLAFMVALYGFTEVLGAGEWAQRIAILHATILGMAYRCYDMQNTVAAREQLLHEPTNEEYDGEPMIEHLPSPF